MDEFEYVVCMIYIYINNTIPCAIRVCFGPPMRTAGSISFKVGLGLPWFHAICACAGEAYP